MADPSKYQVSEQDVQFASYSPDHPRAKVIAAKMRASRVLPAHEALGQQIVALEAETAALAPTPEEVQTEGFHAGTMRHVDRSHPDYAVVARVRAYREKALKLEAMRVEYAEQVQRLSSLESILELAEGELAQFSADETRRQQAEAARQESARRFPNAHRSA